MPPPDGAEVIEHEAAVGLAIEIRLRELRRRGDREIHRLAPQLLDRLLLLGADLAPRPLEQRFLLFARLRQQLLALLLRHRLGGRQDLLRFGAGRVQCQLVLLEQPRRLGIGLLGVGQLFGDALLALLHRLEEGGPPQPPQQPHEDQEDEYRPEYHARVDVERAGDGAALRLLPQRHQEQHSLISLKSSAKTSAARPTPSTSAAVRIMAPRMSPDACGWRAMPSTALPPICPMPMPTPTTARPSPMPAPSRALVLSAVAASGAAWSSSSMFTMTILVESGPSALVLVLQHADEDGRQEREDVCLQERHQQLEAHHEQHERHGARGDGPAAEQEDETEQREDHEVPRRHIGEQPETKGERLDQLADQLDRRHQQRHRDRAEPLHPGWDEDDRLEVALRSQREKPGDLGDEKRENRERPRHDDVPRGRRAEGDQAQQVAVEHEEEKREDVGRDLPAVVADVRDRDVVAHEQGDGFDGRAESRGALPVPVALLVAAPRREHREPDEHRREEHEDDVLGGRDVDAEERPPGGKAPLAPRQLDNVTVRRVPEDHAADVRCLHHFKNLVSRKSSGSRTATYPSIVSSSGSALRCVADTASSSPSTSARTPIPAYQRAMNTCCGAAMAGRSTATAASCVRAAMPPPIPAPRPPTSAAPIASTAPQAASVA